MPTDLDYWNTDDGPIEDVSSEFDPASLTANYLADHGVAFDSPEDY
jgi:hypothetical protein